MRRFFRGAALLVSVHGEWYEGRLLLQPVLRGFLSKTMRGRLSGTHNLPSLFNFVTNQPEALCMS